MSPVMSPCLPMSNVYLLSAAHHTPCTSLLHIDVWFEALCSIPGFTPGGLCRMTGLGGLWW